MFVSAENGKRVQAIGHSQIWHVLAVSIVGESGGKQTLLYDCSENEFLVDGFRAAEDPDHFYDTFIEGYMPIFTAQD